MRCGESATALVALDPCAILNAVARVQDDFVARCKPVDHFGPAIVAVVDRDRREFGSSFNDAKNRPFVAPAKERADRRANGVVAS